MNGHAAYGMGYRSASEGPGRRKTADVGTRCRLKASDVTFSRRFFGWDTGNRFGPKYYAHRIVFISSDLHGQLAGAG